MADGEVSVLIGGRAGDGISSAGQVVAQLLGQHGYRIHMYLDYPSRIKGGHNFTVVRGAGEQVGAIREKVDFILALNQETVDLHRSKLGDSGVVVYDKGSVRNTDGIGVDIKEILNALDAPQVMGNSAIIGAFAKVAGMDWDTVERVFRKAIPRGVSRNLEVARLAYDSAEERIRVARLDRPTLPVFTGNEAIGIGLIEGGLEAYFGYPMSPTSNILHFLVGQQEDARIRVFQPESEIAVVLMALGCAYAGTRAAVGTSGGGFCLMTEAISLAGIAELPLPIILGQRSGPSTGLATYTAQGDLHFALNSGHGEFPRLVVAAGDAEEARSWTTVCMDLAWKYQVPAILLSDKIICEGMYSLDPWNAGDNRAEPILAEDEHPYLRYAFAESGISPLLFPPAKGEVIRVNSHVHDTDGITTEDPDLTEGMAKKRWRKMALLKDEIEGMNPVHVLGDSDSSTALLCWGSGKWICHEIGKRLDLRVIQPVVLQPFPEVGFASAMDGVTRFYGVETNETGQLCRLVKEFGYRPEDMVLKYDGRPFLVEELEARLREVVL